MDTLPTSQIATRNGHRKDFSRITTSLPIPNLIDVQRRSYERFLQMNLLPEERANQGLQAVFTGIFPFSDFRETCSLDFVKYQIGDWQCKCGELKGLEYLRMTCTNCGAKIMTDHPHEETVTCTECGFVNKNRVTKDYRTILDRKKVEEVFTSFGAELPAPTLVVMVGVVPRTILFEQGLGRKAGAARWKDFRSADDPEALTFDLADTARHHHLRLRDCAVEFRAALQPRFLHPADGPRVQLGPRCLRSCAA